LERVEGAVSRPELAGRGDTWLVWASYDGPRIAAGALKPGEYIASDRRFVECSGGTDVLTIRERITRMPDDLGVVYDAAGLQVGLVTSTDGNLASWRRDRAGYLTPGQLAQRATGAADSEVWAGGEANAVD
jgi:hypothetical protein